MSFFPSAFKIFSFDIYFNNLIMMYFCMGSFFKKIMLIFFFFSSVLGLHCCVGFYLVVVRGGYSLVMVHELLIALVFFVADHGL